MHNHNQTEVGLPWSVTVSIDCLLVSLRAQKSPLFPSRAISAPIVDEWISCVWSVFRAEETIPQRFPFPPSLSSLRRSSSSSLQSARCLAVYCNKLACPIQWNSSYRVTSKFLQIPPDSFLFEHPAALSTLIHLIYRHQKGAKSL